VHAAVAAQHHVVQHRQLAEQAQVLEGAAHAQFAHACGGSADTSRPAKRMLPLLGGTMPLSMLIMVLLPAPLGPISAWMWPRCS
jgi:hypothetical protein